MLPPEVVCPDGPLVAGMPQACPHEVVPPERAPRGAPGLRGCAYVAMCLCVRKHSIRHPDIEAFRHAYRPISVMRPGVHGIRQAIKWSADAKGVMPTARKHASGGAQSAHPGDRCDGAF